MMLTYVKSLNDEVKNDIQEIITELKNSVEPKDIGINGYLIEDVVYVLEKVYY